MSFKNYLKDKQCPVSTKIERVTIKSEDKVGMNTSSPAAVLRVAPVIAPSVKLEQDLRGSIVNRAKVIYEGLPAPVKKSEPTKVVGNSKKFGKSVNRAAMLL